MTGRYGKPDRQQAEAYVHHDAEAFGGNAERDIERLDKFIDDVRVVAVDDHVAAGFTQFNVAQWFGGKAVPGCAIGGLVTAAPYRGRGVGRTLLMGHLRESHDAGRPLSVLFPSTPTFYRKCGYEVAGRACFWSVDPDELPRFDTKASIEQFELNDLDVRDCYASWAATQNGMLKRDAFLWERKLGAGRDPFYRYRFVFDGRTEGYAAISGDRSDGLVVTDYAATSLRARKAILMFLHDHRSVNGRVIWPGGPADPLRMMIPENAARISRGSDDWFLRLTHVQAAFEHRGYPNIHCELHLDVNDPQLPENAGRYVLTIRGGKPTVQRGGHGAIRIDVGGLASLYSGYMTAEQLADIGLVEGLADQLAAATTAFGGPAPFMTDKY